jgi:phage-related minor tail protein
VSKEDIAITIDECGMIPTITTMKTAKEILMPMIDELIEEKNSKLQSIKTLITAQTNWLNDFGSDSPKGWYNMYKQIKQILEE